MTTTKILHTLRFVNLYYILLHIIYLLNSICYVLFCLCFQPIILLYYSICRVIYYTYILLFLNIIIQIPIFHPKTHFISINVLTCPGFIEGQLTC